MKVGLFTVPEVAARAGISTHNARYIIRTRGILPIARIGTQAIYRTSDVEKVKTARREIEAKKDRG